MHTVLWNRVKGLQDTVTRLPIPFIGRQGNASTVDPDEPDEVEQAARLMQEREREREDVEAPLLQSSPSAIVDLDTELEADGLVQMEPETKTKGSSIAASVFNLTNTIIGAGIMALPHAVAVVGVILGPLLIFLVYLLSTVTIDILARASERTNKWTFGDVISAYLGKAGSLSLRFFILVNNGGLLITYLIMLGDVLVGNAPDYNGAITNLAGIHTGNAWFLDRRFVVAVVVVVFLLPITLRKSLKSLAWAGAVSLLLSTAFSALVVLLAVLAGLQGRITLDTIYLLPNPDLTGPKVLDQVLGVFSVLPVIALSFVCHYNVHPLIRELHNYTRRRWGIVLNVSMIFCTVVYVVIGTGLYLVFQDGTRTDVLLNFSGKSLGPLIGEQVAEVITYVVWLGYAFNLIVTYPMILWGLREVICETIWGTPEVSALPWASVTVCSLLATYGIAISVPDIWPVMTIVGATAAVFIGWIYPALILARMEGPHAAARVLAAVLLILLGLITAAIAIWSVLGPYILKLLGSNA